MKLAIMQGVDVSSTVPADMVAHIARKCLIDEVRTWPKPGLVSHVDTGSHTDMTAAHFEASARAISPYFSDLYRAGYAGADLPVLRKVGLAAEAAMLRATRGINTHRGAIWALGLLSAALGWRVARGEALPCCDVVRRVWGSDILATTHEPSSHGGVVHRLYGAGGARIEAGLGFPFIRSVGLPALKKGRELCPGDEEAARVQCCIALIAQLEDTNILYRGGTEGLSYAQTGAAMFLRRGGVGKPGWRVHAETLHRGFVSRRLSPGGAADGLAVSLFLERTEKTIS
ncbi:triphosphoribosyl-dephospho-CoA synthase MdcB [Acetobacter senegalensis]|uniref:triphosphoribosyl-dephospho-CoA synthase MdcB n=1 Tax=Acetobacter senegalensis TaxID=446692 RepID=UPI001EDA567D|nr:triphosphoribosyl-dephospho-CoA synthase MdcB [Acetobacter senegalensis]